jgi:hypothetical protein
MGGTTSKNLLDNFTVLEKEIDNQSGLLKFLKQYSQYTCLKGIIETNITMHINTSQEKTLLINYKYLDNIKNIQFPCIIKEKHIAKNSLEYHNGIKEHTEAQNVMGALIESTIKSFNINEITKLRKKTEELINRNNAFIEKSTTVDDIVEEKNNILREYRKSLEYIIRQNSTQLIVKQEPKQIRKVVSKEIEILEKLSIIRRDLDDNEERINEIGWKDLFNTEEEILERDRLIAKKVSLIEKVKELNNIYPLADNITTLETGFLKHTKTFLDNYTKQKEENKIEIGKSEALLKDLKYYRKFIDDTYKDNDKYVVLSISKTLECIEMKRRPKRFNLVKGYSREYLERYLYSAKKIKEIIDERITRNRFLTTRGGPNIIPKTPMSYNNIDYEIFNKYKDKDDKEIFDIDRAVLIGVENKNLNNYIDSDLIYVIFCIEYLTEELEKADEKKKPNINLEIKTLNEDKVIIEGIIQELQGLQGLQKERVLDENTILAYYNTLQPIHKKIFKKYFATYYTKIKALLPTMTGGKVRRHAKKQILGKERCIYKKTGDRKEYVKHKGNLITVNDYRKLMKR